MEWGNPDTAQRKSAPRGRIEMNLLALDQLFNSMDPTPFTRRDLDRNAEEFIVGWAHEFPMSEPLLLRIHLKEWPAEDPTAVIGEAIHNYFAYRAKIRRLELRRLFKQARASLLIGLCCLAVCLFATQYLSAIGSNTWSAVLQQSLTIAGWVAMWRPMQLLLHDWWPVRHQARILEKLATMPVEVLRGGKG